MRTSEFIELTDPDFEGFVIGSVEISPGVFRIRRIPKAFLVVTGPPGPQGPQGTGVGDMLKATYDPTSIDERLIGVTEFSAAVAGRQPLDSTLTSLAGYNTNGILTQTAPDTFVGRTIQGSSTISVNDGSGVAANPTIFLTGSATKRQFGITIDGGGSAITTGIKGYIRIPQDMAITGWDIVADVAGDIVVDAWKDSYANFPPTVADTFVAGVKPTLSTVDKNTFSFVIPVLVSEGDYVAFNVDSAATVTRVHVAFFGTLT